MSMLNEALRCGTGDSLMVCHWIGCAACNLVYQTPQGGDIPPLSGGIDRHNNLDTVSPYGLRWRDIHERLPLPPLSHLHKDRGCPPALNPEATWSTTIYKVFS